VPANSQGRPQLPQRALGFSRKPEPPLNSKLGCSALPLSFSFHADVHFPPGVLLPFQRRTTRASTDRPVPPSFYRTSFRLPTWRTATPTHYPGDFSVFFFFVWLFPRTISTGPVFQQQATFHPSTLAFPLLFPFSRTLRAYGHRHAHSLTNAMRIFL